MSAERRNSESGENPILITGGCGFLGSNLADALAQRGASVLLFDNFSRSGSELNAEWLRKRYGDRMTIEEGDIRDELAVNNVVSRSSAVLHLAAQVAVTTSVAAPRDDFDINARGTLNVLEAVRTLKPASPVIFASTNKVYGKAVEDRDLAPVGNRYAPVQDRHAHGVSEDAPLDLHSPYGCSKGAADQYVRDYARVFGLRTVVLRMSCIYGPRQFGNEDQGWIAHFLIQAIRNGSITIYGDGRQVRDALFVGDAVSAWLRVLERIDEVSGSIFNLGGGLENALSLRDLLESIEQMRGGAPRVQFDEWRPGDQLWYVSDIRTLERSLGWRPSIGLRNGLRELERWLEEHLAGHGHRSRASLQEASA